MRISDWSSDVFSSDLTPHHGAPMLRSMAAHNRRELIAAVRARADLVFLSPVFATRSHTGAPTLGPLRFGLTARRAGIPIVPLGGMRSDESRVGKGGVSTCRSRWEPVQFKKKKD